MKRATLSSPQLKARRARMRALGKLARLTLSLFLLLPAVFYFAGKPQIQLEPVSNDQDALLDVSPTNSLKSVVNNATTIFEQSLTAVLPVTVDTLPNLASVLTTLFVSPSKLDRIVLAFPEQILAETRRVTRTIVSTMDETHPELVLHPYIYDTEREAGVLHAIARTSAEWILLLDEYGLQKITEQTRKLLLNPSAIYYPVGPRGVLVSPGNTTCLKASIEPQLASFLVPPFVIPSSLLLDNHRTWSSKLSLNEGFFRNTIDNMGGIVLGFEHELKWCAKAQRDMISATLPSANNHWNETLSSRSLKIVALILPSLQDLRIFSAVACQIRENNDSILRILLYETDLEMSTGQAGEAAFSGKCRLRYNTLSHESGPGYSKISSWLDSLAQLPAVTLSVDIDIPANLVLIAKQLPYSASTWIHLPRKDLPYCSWMGMLSLQEWQSWNTPSIDLSVITKDRPRSLERLLSSLTHAVYFGDSLNLRINLDQTSDAESLKVAERFQWDHGSVFVHHRVIHGGLLPAVVESWYPHSNHSYGVILEDDVELSPLFYAWIKMTILRYRYGPNRSTQLYGVSLYQQKNIELRPEGRRPFNATDLFTGYGLPYPNTPYLSQIPCSWGAVYFPEHWREFHDYLSIRLSELTLLIDENVVPDVRSNRWTKSWKKFFIELVYLRGYVMLYPNFPEFVSLSTNHLEVGSHVKDSPSDVYMRKRDLFLLPLMQLPLETGHRSVGLLDLPRQTLPQWQDLPVLDLLGSPTPLETLVHRGLDRRAELMNCSTTPAEYDVRELMCIVE